MTEPTGTPVRLSDATVAIMLAMPGLLAGIISQWKARATLEVAIGPRNIVLVGAVIPYAVAVLLNLGVADETTVRYLAQAGASVNVFGAMLLLAIRGLPRTPQVSLGHFGGEDSERLRWYHRREKLAAFTLFGCVLSAVLCWQVIDAIT